MSEKITVETLKESLTKVIDDLDKLKNLSEDKEKEIEDLKRKNQELKDESQKTKKELESINSELTQLSKEFQMVSEEKAKKVDTREALKILMVLLRDVFGGQAHGVVLRLLHNQESKVLSRDIIAKSSGFGGAIIRKVAADLQQAGIVEYDIETGDVKLTKEIFD